MTRIKTDGVLDFGADTDAVMAEARAIFQAGRASDEQIEGGKGASDVLQLGHAHARVAACIAQYQKSAQYLLCPHTAAGVHVMKYVWLGKGWRVFGECLG
jgi:hypothetical protein